MTHGEREGQADAEAAPDELEGLVDEMRGSFGRRREWQHHDIHEQINQSAIDEAASDRAIEQECEANCRKMPLNRNNCPTVRGKATTTTTGLVTLDHVRRGTRLIITSLICTHSTQS